MLTIILGVLAVIGVAAAIYFRGRLSTAETSNETLQGKLAAAERERGQAMTAAARHEAVLETERASHETQMGQLREETAKQVALVAGNREELAEQMKAISSDAVKEASGQLAEIAEESRKADREIADSRAQEFKNAVSPMKESLERLGNKVEALDKDRKETEGQVKQMFESVQTAVVDLRLETGQLKSALKRPSVRGSWGEMQLKNVVKVAGMTEHVDFASQPTIDAGDDGRLRPDMTVHMPSGRDVVVDAKVPLDAYLDAVEAADDPEAQATHLNRHARQLKSHIDKLGSKAYHQRLDTQAELVICFLPNDAVYCAALDRDPGLLDHGVAKKVLIATPTTLLALLHACRYGWQAAEIEESAREIVEAGRELHRRFGTFLGEFNKTGRFLDRARNAFSAAAASAETRLLPQLRRIEETGARSEKEIFAPRELELPPRLVSAPEVEDPGPEPHEPEEAPPAAAA
jgi:DNA recombination protein RmuC